MCYKYILCCKYTLRDKWIYISNFHIIKIQCTKFDFKIFQLRTCPAPVDCITRTPSVLFRRASAFGTNHAGRKCLHPILVLPGLRLTPPLLRRHLELLTYCLIGTTWTIELNHNSYDSYSTLVHSLADPPGRVHVHTCTTCEDALSSQATIAIQLNARRLTLVLNEEKSSFQR